MSLKKQIFTQFEVIIVDDGSTDNSNRLCTSITNIDSRFKLLTKKNGGLASARNYGLSYASGEYICFVDSDDFVDDDFLLNYFVALENDELDLIYAGIKYFPSGRQIVPKFPLLEVMSGKQYISSCPLLSSTASIPFTVRYCFKRTFLQSHNLQFNEKIRYAEDAPFNLSAFYLAKKIKCIPNISYNYRVNENSITQNFKPTMIEDSDYLYNTKKTVQLDEANSQYLYEKDYTNVHINSWIPSIIENFKRNNKLTFKDAKKLLNANFVQDGVRFILTNKLYTRKIQKLYFIAIRNKMTFPIFILWRTGKLRFVIGIK